MIAAGSGTMLRFDSREICNSDDVISSHDASSKTTVVGSIL